MAAERISILPPRDEFRHFRIRCHICDTRSTGPIFRNGQWLTMCCLKPAQEKDLEQ